MLHFLIFATQKESNGQNTETTVIKSKTKFNTSNKISWQQIWTYQQHRPESICILAIINIQIELDGQNTDIMDYRNSIPP